jgi:hypothetical protein
MQNYTVTKCFFQWKKLNSRQDLVLVEETSQLSRVIVLQKFHRAPKMNRIDWKKNQYWCWMKFNNTHVFVVIFNVAVRQCEFLKRRWHISFIFHHRLILRQNLIFLPSSIQLIRHLMHPFLMNVVFNVVSY